MSKLSKAGTRTAVMLVVASLLMGLLGGCQGNNQSTISKVEGKTKKEIQVDKGEASKFNKDKRQNLDNMGVETTAPVVDGTAEGLDYNARATKTLSLLANSDENVLISPLSIELALAMVYNGLDIDGQATLEKYFGQDLSSLNTSNKSRIQELANSDEVLSLANSIWVKEEYKDNINEAFKKVLSDNYGADVNTFGTSPEVMNEWVNDKTNGMIPSIIDELSPELRVVLLNAIYFRGEWLTEFDGSKVDKADFTLSDGTKVECDMMAGKGDVYMETNEVVAFKKNYDAGYSFIGILPKDTETFQIENLNIQELLDTSAYNYTTRIKIPKFNSDYSTSLTKILSGLGISDILRDGAVSSILDTDEILAISDIIHKTAIKVDEKGTEAAGVTGIMVGATSASVAEPEVKEVYLDSPFVYAILNDNTKEVVFIGTVNNPNG